MNVQQYLRRIDHRSQIQSDVNSLSELHVNHLLAIPFENLDIHYNVPISLNIGDMYRKIVDGLRGGFCYELNGLFHELLSRLGFRCKLVSARVHESGDRYGPEFDHVAIVVALGDSEFLVDVGFGDFFLTPKEIVVGKPQPDLSGEYVFDRYDEYLRINKRNGRELLPQYIFKNRKVTLDQFESRSQFHQTDAASHFHRKKVVTIVTRDGRKTLTDGRLISTSGSNRQEVCFAPSRFEDQLWDVFGIKASLIRNSH